MYDRVILTIIVNFIFKIQDYLSTLARCQPNSLVRSQPSPGTSMANQKKNIRVFTENIYVNCQSSAKNIQIVVKSMNG